MSWKPSEQEIMDYLLGQLSPAMAQKFAGYLQHNPEFAREMAALGATRKVLATIPDEEVIPPASLLAGTRKAGQVKKGRPWLYPVSIAASLALVLLTGYFTNFSLSAGKDGIRVSFREEVAPPSALAAETVQAMIDTRLAGERQHWQQQLLAAENRYATGLAESKQFTRQEVARLAAQPPVIDQKYLDEFADRMTTANRQMMQEFFASSAMAQQKYLRNVLLEFQAYLYEQRQQDMQMISTSLLDIIQENEEKQQLTAKILADIITTVTSQNSPGR